MAREPYKIRKILMVRMSAIGDIILTTPLIRAAKSAFPEATIDFLTKQKYAELLEHHPLLRRAIGFDTDQGISGLLALIGELRKEHYDLVVDLQLNPRSILVRYLCGAHMQRRALKYSLERRLLKWFRINLLKKAPPVPERYFTALEDFNVRPNGYGPEIFPSAADEQKAEALLQKAGAAGQKLIGLAPGASRFTKIWPADRFAAAGEKLAKSLGAGIVILGGVEDSLISEQVVKKLKTNGTGPVLNLAGELSILQSTAVLKRLKLLLANDTALMHLATAVGTPVVAVFGPTTREFGFFPYSQKATVIQKAGMDCRPCSLHGDKSCPEQHFRCMLEIDPDQVAAAGSALLSETGAGKRP